VAPGEPQNERPESSPSPSVTLTPDDQRRTSNSIIIRGVGGGFIAGAAPLRRPGAIDDQGDISLNFLNADVRDVVKAVLGDMLRLNYLVENSAQGTVTIQTNHPISRDAVLPALEQALRLSGLAIVKAGDVYKVVPSVEAPQQSGITSIGSGNRERAPGFGVEIVPLKYVGAAELQHLLEPMAPSGAILRVDSARNLLIIGGSEEERAALIDDIALFDVDSLAGRSFALFTLKAVDPKTMAAELGEVIGGKDSPLAGLVHLVPIEHMNALLAISPQPKYLEQLQSWVARLDHGSETADQRIYVYYVQNGRASDLAKVLLQVLGSSEQIGTQSLVPPGVAETIIAPPPTGLVGLPAPGMPYTGVLPLPVAPRPIFPPQLGSQQQTPPSRSVAEAGNAPAPDEGVSIPSLADIHITPEDMNNALVILATAKQYGVIEAALRKLDIAPLQVLLEAAIAEVTLTNDLRYGVQYFFKAGKNQVVRTSTGTSVIAPSFPGFAYSFATNSNINVVLDALEDITHVNVLSSPKLLVLNNQTATLQVGDQVPVATQSAVSVQSPGAPVVNSIEFKDTGVILKVVPRVNEGGVVLMDISQEVSNVAATTTSTINSPTIQQRKISSTVVVQDGETIALGGLISDNRTRERSGIPWLQDIPVLGNAFRTTSDNDTRTELLVLITPHVVQGVQRARAITEELRHQMPAAETVIGPPR
jgi:general secretion pathway protein D